VVGRIAMILRRKRGVYWYKADGEEIMVELVIRVRKQWRETDT